MSDLGQDLVATRPQAQQMTLRTRLVIAIVVLTTVGLAVFGATTYSLYRRSLENRLDDQLRAAIAPLSRRLVSEAVGFTTGPGFPGARSNDDQTGRPRPPRQTQGGFGFDNYAALINADGEVVSSIDPGITDALPNLNNWWTDTTRPQFSNTGSVSGSGEWRVLVEPLSTVPVARGGRRIPARLTNLDGAIVVIASPTTELDAQMNRLLQIELAAAAVLLTVLASGAWLVLRRGLRPLEQMAESASAITVGDLSERVTPADGRTEVGQLGLALNTMLDGIEGSFREREATELRLRQFLADASHELRTPLTSIQGFAELFRLGAANDQVDLPIIMRRIEQEAGRMKVLVEDLLLLARIDETRPFDPEPVDLTVLAADACSDAVATAPDRKITLDAPSPAVVRGDGDGLRQAIANLVTNALKHTPEGTPIEVSTAVTGGRASVTVRDHGPGVDDATRQHGFDRFWQADPARVGAGNGLGLAIVTGIAQQHGGVASVMNRADGGAAFTIEIPIAGPWPPEGDRPDQLSEPLSDAGMGSDAGSGSG